MYEALRLLLAPPAAREARAAFGSLLLLIPGDWTVGGYNEVRDPGRRYVVEEARPGDGVCRAGVSTGRDRRIGTVAEVGPDIPAGVTERVRGD